MHRMVATKVLESCKQKLCAGVKAMPVAACNFQMLVPECNICQPPIITMLLWAGKPEC
jgi:hypothetical protein